MAQMHEVDFEIHGSEMQFVTVELDPGEAAVAPEAARRSLKEACALLRYQPELAEVKAACRPMLD